jgi:phage-related protein (TIGR01555 family)
VSDHVNGEGERPRFRVPAGNSADRLGSMTTDSLTNFVARLGVNQANLLSGSSYDFRPVTRMQQMLEWAYRGSWIIGAACDIIADDMTRAGVQFNSDTDPDDIEQLHTAMNDMMLWQSLNETIKWSRLYGGALMVMLIDGQDPTTELDPETVGIGQLKGFMVLDRWVVQSVFNDLVMVPGPDYGMPKYYEMVATAPFLPQMKIHHTRWRRPTVSAARRRERMGNVGRGKAV